MLQKLYLTWNPKHEKVINFKVMFNWQMLEEETKRKEKCVSSGSSLGGGS